MTGTEPLARTDVRAAPLTQALCANLAAGQSRTAVRHSVCGIVSERFSPRDERCRLARRGQQAVINPRHRGGPGSELAGHRSGHALAGRSTSPLAHFSATAAKKKAFGTTSARPGPRGNDCRTGRLRATG